MTLKPNESSIFRMHAKAALHRQRPILVPRKGDGSKSSRGGIDRIAPYGFSVDEACVSSALELGIQTTLSDGTKKELDRISHVACFPEGVAIFVEGQAARGVYVLCQGCVKMSTTNRDGKTFIIRISHPGEILGLQPAVTGTEYQLTIQTLLPSQLGFIGRADFLRLINNYADAAMLVARQLGEECQSAYDVIRSIGLSHSVSEKFARLLLQWCDHGRVSDGSIQVNISLTQEEMAQLIGTTRETVTRTLSGLKKQRVLEWIGSTLLIRDRAALEKIVGNSA